MELPRLVSLRLSSRVLRAVRLLFAILALLCAGVSGARAADSTGQPVPVSDPAQPPPGFRLTGNRVRQIAARDPRVAPELRTHPGLRAYEYTKGARRWQVSWFTPGAKPRELAQAYVQDSTGRVSEAWTGFQVAWTMARGYPGAFGAHLNLWYVWSALCLLFTLPFLPLRPPRRLTLLHLDLAVLLGFSVSLAFFNHGEIGLSVPLALPCLLYLLVRMLLLGFGRGRPSAPLILQVPPAWLAVGIMLLVGFRVGLNLTDSNVIDVGYAGVIGADRILHDRPPYGSYPHDNVNGDTYGPVNYEAYVPFRAAFGWSGRWDDLPAAHGAAVAFDLLTLLGLFWLGRMVRGPTTGIVLAYAWASYPFTLYALASDSNDTLVALLVVVALLLVRCAPGRGAAGALAALTKFAPLALAPLLLRGTGTWPRPRALFGFVAAFALAGAAVMLPVLLHHNLATFWQDTIEYQSGRESPFSVWGLWGGLGSEQHLVQGAAAGLALALAFVPVGRRDLPRLCALCAAVLIALQLGISHWFYLYIPWFFPVAIAALVLSHPPAPGSANARGGQKHLLDRVGAQRLGGAD